MKIIRVTCKDEADAKSINKLGNTSKKIVGDIDKLLTSCSKLLDEIFNDGEALEELKKIRGLKARISDMAYDLDRAASCAWDAGA